MANNEKIELLKSSKKAGIMMASVRYHLIANFITSTLEAQHDNKMSLKTLIDLVRSKIGNKFPGDVSWYFLQVKNDMVARGIINSEFTLRDQIISKSASRPKKRNK